MQGLHLHSMQHKEQHGRVQGMVCDMMTAHFQQSFMELLLSLCTSTLCNNPQFPGSETDSVIVLPRAPMLSFLCPHFSEGWVSAKNLLKCI